MVHSMIERLLAALPRATRNTPSDERLIDLIRAEAVLLRTATSDDLRSAATDLRYQAQERRASSSSVLVSAFAAVCEAVRRSCGLELFDVQLQAGLAIARGDIAEMQTGEGKTLAAAPPAFLQAIEGGGVHIVTPNSYLAWRDYELLAPVYRSLGCSVGLLPESAPLVGKRAAYACDIIYGTGYEFGFDYLREQLGLLGRQRARLGERYWKLLHDAAEPFPLGARRGFAIIDEIDSVLIDEACTPLILSDAPGDDGADTMIYEHALRVAATLVIERDFVVEVERSKHVVLTESGRKRCYEAMCGELQDRPLGPWSDTIQQALQAIHVLRRDVDYVVTAGKLVIVDQATGRLCPDRAWRNGLQQVLEAKEGLRLTPARPTAARITRQRYFRLYQRLAGMTGTAAESAEEFSKTYGLRVAAIPPRLLSRRVMLPDRVFVDNDSRLCAAEVEIARLHPTGRPLLVGCRTIERSAQLAVRLNRLQIDYQLLNGKQTAAEADIVARAGRRGAVTIATNMAGRGTDIKLEQGVAQLGGMHLVAVERNDSLRVDRQLIGRVGRQGDPGSCQFFVSADDALVERFGLELQRQASALPSTAGEVHADLSRPIRAAQRRAEAASRRVRDELAAADTWLCDELGGLMH